MEWNGRQQPGQVNELHRRSAGIMAMDARHGASSSLDTGPGKLRLCVTDQRIAFFQGRQQACVPVVNVFSKGGGSVFGGPGREIDDVYRYRPDKPYAAGFPRIDLVFELVVAPLPRHRKRGCQTLYSFDPHSAGAVCAHAGVEQVPVGGVMEVYGEWIRHVQLDLPKRVLRRRVLPQCVGE